MAHRALHIAHCAFRASARTSHIAHRTSRIARFARRRRTSQIARRTSRVAHLALQVVYDEVFSENGEVVLLGWGPDATNRKLKVRVMPPPFGPGGQTIFERSPHHIWPDGGRPPQPKKGPSLKQPRPKAGQEEKARSPNAPWGKEKCRFGNTDFALPITHHPSTGLLCPAPHAHTKNASETTRPAHHAHTGHVGSSVVSTCWGAFGDLTYRHLVHADAHWEYKGEEFVVVFAAVWLGTSLAFHISHFTFRISHFACRAARRRYAPHMARGTWRMAHRASRTSTPPASDVPSACQVRAQSRTST